MLQTDLTSPPIVSTNPPPPPHRTQQTELPNILTSTSTTSPRYTGFPANDRGRNIRLIALNDPYAGTGKNKIKEDADDQCHKQSGRLYRKGKFVAFRATKQQYLKGLVSKEDWSLPVVNVFEKPLFDSWESIFNGSGGVIDTYYNRGNIYTFKGYNVFIDDKWKERKIWHGATNTGKYNENCNDWSSNSPFDYGTGSSIGSHLLLGQEKISCDKELIVLCVEVKNVNFNTNNENSIVNNKRSKNNKNYISRRSKLRHYHSRHKYFN